MPGAGQHTREKVLQAIRYRLDQWVVSVGTIGDRTTLGDVQKMVGMSVVELRGDLAPLDSRILSDKDMLLVQENVRLVAGQARDILQNDSIAQRLTRSVGGGANYAIEQGKAVLSSIVQGAHDAGMAPLPLFSVPSSGRHR